MRPMHVVSELPIAEMTREELIFEADRITVLWGCHVKQCQQGNDNPYRWRRMRQSLVRLGRIKLRSERLTVGG